jgi:outer membrane protein TolC
VPETTILNQKAQVSQLTQQLMEQRRSRDESELRLATLIGRHAGDLEVPVEPLRVAVELPEVPGVLPADMLARRPDVLAVEYRLLEKHHLLGRARLARLPTFNLNGAISALTGAWSVGLVESVSTLFDRETGVAVKRSEIERDVLVEEYRKTVLSAFEEVEIALLNLQARRRQMEQLSEQIAALEVVHRVQTERLKEGFVSQLELFQTEQNLLTAQQGMLSTYQQILTDTVTLYKALGGGWPKQTVHEDATVRRAASVEQMQQK